MKILISIIFSLSMIFTYPLFGQTPGSTSDPLVSKSYLDHFFKFKSIVLPSNKTLYPSPGSLIIIRSGELILEAPKGKTLVDLTTGKEIKSGATLPLNHLIIIPDSASYKLTAKKLTLMLGAYLQDTNK